MFVPEEAFSVNTAFSSASGFFRGASGMSLLIVADGERKWGVHLEPSTEQFAFYEVNRHWREKGLTFSNIRAEVDFSSMCDAVLQGRPGDLVRSEAGAHLIATSGAGFRGVPTHFALEGAEAQPSHPAVAFRSWRLVSGPADDPIVLWERSGEAA